MTSRLYYTDAYLASFDGRITEIADDGRRVYLDQSAFYPASGGQPFDLGSLAGALVADVVDEDVRVAHVLTAPLSGHTVGDAVHGEIDWHRRFDHMQQHTGQHLLSAVFADVLGYETASVHFGADRSSLDLDVGAIDAQRLGDAERRANEIIWENRHVTVTFEESATTSGLRKPPPREGTLRVVTIDALDRSACGGTHVRATGEIGAIVLRGTERMRKQTRVEFLCGGRVDSSGTRRLRDAVHDRVLTEGIGGGGARAGRGAERAVARRHVGAEAPRRRARRASRPRALRLHVADTGRRTRRRRAAGRRLARGAAPTGPGIRGIAEGSVHRRHRVAATVLVAASEDSGVDAGSVLKAR